MTEALEIFAAVAIVSGVVCLGAALAYWLW